jgi:GNAT superfamily N-acetyltransferase
MIKTLDILQAQKKKLFEKNPELKKATVLTLKQTGYSFKDISAFIELCFDHDYQGETRMRFTPEFIEKNANNLSGTVILHDGNIVASVMTFPNTCFSVFPNQTKPNNFVIESALSVHPEYRGKKLGQFIEIETKENLIKEGIDFSVYWLDSRHNKPWHSFNIFGNDQNKIKETTEISLLCKSYNLVRLKKYEKLGFVLYSLLKTIQSIYPLKDNELQGYRVSKFDPALVDKYLDFAQGTTSFESVSIGFDRESFYRLYGPQKRESFFYSLVDETNDKISVLAFGFKSPQRKGDFLAFFDGLIFHENLPKPLKRNFMGVIEADLRDAEKCMAGTIPKNCIKGAFSYGYIPYQKQVLGFDPYKELNFGINEVSKMLIGLR